MTKEGFPELYDLGEVIIDRTSYYGYVDNIDFDMRNPTITLEFFPGYTREFDFKDVKIIPYPS